MREIGEGDVGQKLAEAVEAKDLLEEQVSSALAQCTDSAPTCTCGSTALCVCCLCVCCYCVCTKVKTLNVKSVRLEETLSALNKRLTALGGAGERAEWALRNSEEEKEMLRKQLELCAGTLEQSKEEVKRTHSLTLCTPDASLSALAQCTIAYATQS